MIDERLSHLIVDIYDAALEPERWPDVLGGVAGWVGGKTGAIYSNMPLQKQAVLHFVSGGMDPYWYRLYFERYVRLNPAAIGQMTAPVGQPCGTGDFMPYEEFVRSRFYKEWVEPQGLVDVVVATLDRRGSTLASAVVFRDVRHGRTDAKAIAHMRPLIPHLQRAITIGHLLGEARARADALAEACNGLATPVLLVAADGGTVYANRVASRMLDEGTVLRAEASGKLVAVGDAEANSTFRETLEACARGDITATAKGVALPLAGRDGSRHIVHILPLTSGKRLRVAAGLAATAAIFVQQADQSAPPPVVAISELYALTPAETRVLFTIVELGGVPETAAALGIADSTVRSHLQRVFAKTDCARQADLVKLVTRFASPLAGRQ